MTTQFLAIAPESEPSAIDWVCRVSGWHVCDPPDGAAVGGTWLTNGTEFVFGVGVFTDYRGRHIVSFEQNVFAHGGDILAAVLPVCCCDDDYSNPAYEDLFIETHEQFLKRRWH